MELNKGKKCLLRWGKWRKASVIFPSPRPPQVVGLPGEKGEALAVELDSPTQPWESYVSVPWFPHLYNGYIPNSNHLIQLL